MNSKTLTALNGSIAHWKRLATGKRTSLEGIGPDHCNLCQLFYDDGCLKCPVRIKTGNPYCEESPFEDADAVAALYGLDSYQFRNAARLELAFLKSLLPKQRKP